MIVVGVLLVALAALLAVGFALTSGGSTEAGFYGLILPNLSARVLVLLGVVLGLSMALGIALIRACVARWRRRRRARRLAAGSPVGAEGLEAEDDFPLYPQPQAEPR